MWSCHPPNHDSDGGEVNESFAAGRCPLIILAEPPPAVEPPEDAFDHPATGENLEAMKLGALDHFQRPATHPAHPFDQLAGIAAVGPDQPEAREPKRRTRQQQPRAVPVLEIGRVDHHQQKETEFIHQYVTFATVDFFFPRRIRAGLRHRLF